MNYSGGGGRPIDHCTCTIGNRFSWHMYNHNFSLASFGQGDDYEEMDSFIGDPHYYLQVVEEEQKVQPLIVRVSITQSVH